MPRIPEAELARIKRETDLAALARSRGVELKPRGNDLVGRCPFHGPDDEPSFVVTPSKGLFHCFGCEASGSVIDFVMRFDGLSFRAAVTLLSEGRVLEAVPPAGRPLKSSSVPRLSAPFDLDTPKDMLLSATLSFYHRTLLSPAGSAGMKYLQKRRIASPEAVEHFRIGYADRTLGLRLPQRNRVSGAEIRGKLEEIGLIRATGREHFAGSVVFPILDAHGEIGEVYARKTNDNARKGRPNHLYLPGPHRGIWNFQALRESEEIVLTESIIDALSFWVNGFHHVVSAFGASGVTEEMLEAFKAHDIRRVLIAFDRDPAGERGAAGVAEKLAKIGIGAFRVLFPHGFDANEFALKLTPAPKSLALLLRRGLHSAAESFGEGVIELIMLLMELIAGTISYIRIAVVALVHAALMEMVVSSAPPPPAGLIVEAIGNAGVIALEGLIAFVQSLRLNYYEFLSKFFSGEGVYYSPVRLRYLGVSG